MNKINTAAVVGVGAIGSFFADKLDLALGESFKVIAGGERAERLKKDGLVINGRQRYFHIASPEQKGEFIDFIIIIPKMTGLKQALKDAENYIGPDTIIMTPLNGVESEETAAEVYGWDRMVYSLMRLSSVKNGNVVSFNPDISFVEFGEKTNDENNLSEKVLRIRELFDRAGIRYKNPEDMLKAIWEKFVCNVSENQVAAVLNIPFGAWASCPDANALRIMTAAEVIEIANKKGIMIDKNYAVNHLEYLDKVPHSNKPSTLQDILAGRKTEVDMFAGTIIKLGKETGVPTPFNEFLYHAIKVLEAKNEGTIVGV